MSDKTTQILEKLEIQGLCCLLFNLAVVLTIAIRTASTPEVRRARGRMFERVVKCQLGLPFMTWGEGHEHTRTRIDSAFSFIGETQALIASFPEVEVDNTGALVFKVRVAAPVNPSLIEINFNYPKNKGDNK